MYSRVGRQVQLLVQDCERCHLMPSDLGEGHSRFLGNCIEVFWAYSQALLLQDACHVLRHSSNDHSGEKQPWVVNKTKD
jgi:hypothetical protein